MSKGLKIALICVGVVVLLLIGAAAFAYVAIAKSPTVPAQLHIESGQVLVNGVPATSDMSLEEKDIIETGADGKASVILYESVIINLDPSTRIQISDLVKEHPRVEQSSGETWNQFTKFSGVEGYSISYGDSVASVRGTAFGMSDGKLMTGEGEVQYTIAGENYSVTEDEVVEYLNGKAIERPANAAEKAKMREKKIQMVEVLKVMRDKEMEKSDKAYSIIKDKTGLTDEQVKDAFEEADHGRLDLKDYAGKSPVKIESADKIIQITEKIKELNEEVSMPAVVKEAKVDASDEKSSKSGDSGKSSSESGSSSGKKGSSSDSITASVVAAVSGSSSQSSDSSSSSSSSSSGKGSSSDDSGESNGNGKGKQSVKDKVSSTVDSIL